MYKVYSKPTVVCSIHIQTILSALYQASKLVTITFITCTLIKVFEKGNLLYQYNDYKFKLYVTFTLCL